ncbi:MAG: hypothetical protein AAF668_16105, partial [Pseudomonadota bacterium]
MSVMRFAKLVSASVGVALASICSANAAQIALNPNDNPNGPFNSSFNLFLNQAGGIANFEYNRQNSDVIDQDADLNFFSRTQLSDLP